MKHNAELVINHKTET